MALTDMPEVAWCVRLQCGDGVSLQLRPARAGQPLHFSCQWHKRTGSVRGAIQTRRTLSDSSSTV